MHFWDKNEELRDKTIILILYLVAQTGFHKSSFVYILSCILKLYLLFCVSWSGVRFPKANYFR